MTRETVHDIRMPDGTKRKMTSSEIAAESGVDLKLVRRRLGRWWRDWERITASVEEGRARGRQRFLRGTEAIFAERAEERAAEAAHLQEIEAGHAKL